MHAATGLSRREEPLEAAREAAERVARTLGRVPDLALVLGTQHHSERFDEVGARVGAQLGACRVVGATGLGVLTEEGEVESGPGLAVLALGSSTIRCWSTHVPYPAAGGGWPGAELGRSLGDPGRSRGVVLLPSAEAGGPEEILLELAEAGFGPVPTFGAGLASEDPGHAPVTLHEGRILRKSALALSFEGPGRLQYAFSQAMGPVGRAHPITAVRGQVVLELAGRRAIDVLAEELGETLWEKARQGDVPVLVGFSTEETPVTHLAGGQYVVRNLLAADPIDGSLLVAGRPQVGMDMGFVLRNSLAAREALKSALAGLARDSDGPGFGLYFNCCARGERFHGAPDVDTSYIRNHLPGLPVAGLFGAYEICPVGDRNRMLAYTGVLMVLREEDDASPLAAGRPEGEA